MTDAASLWDARYRESDRIWTRHPNPTLIDLVSRLTPGTAIDVGCGEGGDALWLAQQGWTTTGVDISQVAIDRAQELGTSDDATIRWWQADLASEPLDSTYDLVTTHFMHMPAKPRARLFEHLVGGVALDGHLLIVGHHPSDMTSGVRRPRDPSFFYTAEELTELLDNSWEILVADARAREVDHHGSHATVHDAILFAHRVR